MGGEGEKEQEVKKGKLCSYLSVRVEWGPDWSLAPPSGTQNCFLSGRCEKFNLPLHKASYLEDCHFNQQANRRQTVCDNGTVKSSSLRTCPFA